MNSDISHRDLIAVGDNCLDVYLTQNHMTVGGNALNVAVNWCLSGLSARYFGKIGSDPEGQIVANALAEVGLDISSLEVAQGSTAVTLLTDEEGDRSFLLEDLGVGAEYIPALAQYERLLEADWVHLGTNSSPELLRCLRRDNVAFSIDVSTQHDALDLQGIPLVFAAGSERPDVTPEELLTIFILKGAQQVVVTCGNKGAWFHDGRNIHHCPAKNIQVVDTCGAGDSFIAAFLKAYIIEKIAAEAALRQATNAAAITCSYPGGFPQEMARIPSWLIEKYADIIEKAEI